MSEFIRHEQCPSCAENGNDRQQNNLAVYSDGGVHCFACSYHLNGSEESYYSEREVEIKEFTEESKEKIKKQSSTKGKGFRGLDDKTTSPFGVRYEYDESTGEVNRQYYPTTIKGELVGYKVRYVPKDFRAIGETGKSCDLFGQFKFKTGGKYVLLTGGECFPGDVEVLTECGFVRFDHLEKGMKVYQHSFEATGDFVVPYAYTEKDYKGNLVRTKSSRYDVICTENHNMVYVTQTDKIVVQPASQHFSAGWNLPVTSSYSGCGINLTNDEIALVIAICADSKLDHRVRTNKQAHFAFVKERKIIRLKGILDRLEIPYTSYTNTWVEGKTYTTFNLRIPDYVSDKFLPVSWLKDATREQAEFILNEIIHWDGNLVKERDAFEFNSKHKREVDFVQAMATLVGRYAAVRFRKNQYGEWWSTQVSGKKNKVSCQAIKKTTEYFEGKVYCVSVPTGMIIVRNNGKIAVVGNCDQLSAYQMLRAYQLSKSGGEDYAPVAVVSPTVGETGCKKQIQKQYDFLNQFDRVVIGFDNDEPGRKATEDIIDVLPRGKVWVANWRYKDCNEYLMQGKQKEFIQDFYAAEKHTPAGILSSDKIFDEIMKRAESEKLPFPPFLKGLNDMLAGGITYGFIVNILAGSGCGKSSFINECTIFWTKELDVKVGVVSLEADAGYYGEQLLSRYIGKKIALIDNKEDKLKLLTSEATQKAAKELFTSEDGSPSLYVADDRGDFSQLQEKIEELVVAFGVRVVVIDVISDVFAGFTLDQVDKFMQWEKCLVKQYNCILVNVAHVRKATSGEKAGSQGAFLTEESLIGSGSQYRSAGINISLQRDKTAEDEIERNTTIVHCLKSRDTGNTGKACEVYYDGKSHTLYDKEYYLTHVV